MHLIGRLISLAALMGFPAILLAQRDTPMKVPSAVQEQKLIYRAKVVYPERALAAHISGTVQLAVLIDENGVVRKPRLVSGHPLLVRAAMDSVKKWRYRPRYVRGHPTDVLTTVEVPFVLPDKGIIEPPSGAS
jgi:TonB family protein